MKPLIVDDLDFKQAGEHLGELSKDAVLAGMFYDGEHWHNGDGWLGPRPSEIDPDASAIWDRISKGFVSQNVIKEIVDRAVTSILGYVPDWSFVLKENAPPVPKQVPKKIPLQIPDPNDPTGQNKINDPSGAMIDDPSGDTVDDPTGATEDAPVPDEDQKLIDEAEDLMMNWWSRTSPMEKLQEALRTRLWAGKGYLRIFVPRAFIDTETGAPTQMEAIKWARHIWPDTVAPTAAAIVTDPASMEKISITKLTIDEVDHMEISYVDDNEMTVIVILRQGGDDRAQIEESVNQGQDTQGDQIEGALDDEIMRSDPLDLQGYIVVFETKGQPLITPQIIQQNKLVNMAATMMGHNLIETGFSELTVTNVEMEMMSVPDGNVEGGFRSVPRSLKRGGGVVNNLIGVETEDIETGKKHLATPGVHYRDPGQPDTFIKIKYDAYKTCLSESHQIHALLSGDAAPSGESRIQALADFLMSVHDYKVETDLEGAWLMESVLALIAAASGQPGRFAKLRCDFNCRLYIGRLTALERAAVLSEVKARMRSRASGMVQLGIDDPKAMMTEIANEDKMITPVPAAPSIPLIPPPPPK